MARTYRRPRSLEIIQNRPAYGKALKETPVNINQRFLFSIIPGALPQPGAP
jgi:hypothetical protein